MTPNQERNSRCKKESDGTSTDENHIITNKKCTCDGWCKRLALWIRSCRNRDYPKCVTEIKHWGRRTKRNLSNYVTSSKSFNELIYGVPEQRKYFKKNSQKSSRFDESYDLTHPRISLNPVQIKPQKNTPDAPERNDRKHVKKRGNSRSALTTEKDRPPKTTVGNSSSGNATRTEPVTGDKGVFQ